MKKSILLFVLILILSSYIPMVRGDINPVAVVGWVYMEDGPPAANAPITVFNNDTGGYANTTTNDTGVYAATIGGDTGHTIWVNCSHLGEVGSNTTTVDLADPTHYCNLSLVTAAVPPVARFTYSPALPIVGETIVFTDYSTDEDGQVVGWLWDYGDGHTSVGKSASHSYDSEGTYTVVLTVTDDDGLTDTAKETIRVRTTIIDRNITIPKPKPPLYPGFTVPEMYGLLRVSNLSESSSKVTVVFIDTGYTPRTYMGIDLTEIEAYHHPRYVSAIDRAGHGTFVSYELAYILQTKLPNAILISYRVLDENGACTSKMFLESLDAVKRFNPDVISISAGAIGHPDDVFSKKVGELRASGIIVVCAAGNLGPTSSTILSPACSASALGIAGSNPQWADDYDERQRIILNLSDDTICPWSSRGPVPNVYPKPDVTSPGESIIGPYLNGERILSGTSMSTPLIAGGTAVVLANNEGFADIVKIIYFWDGAIIPNVFEDSLKEGCFRKGDVNDWGMGIPVFTTVNDIFFWKLIILILIPIIVAITITIFIFVVRWRWKKARGKKPSKKPLR